MKNLLLACLFIFSFVNKSKAQFVTIPDANFVSYLQTNFPSAMVGNMMDTTDASILNTIWLQLPNPNGLISDLTGLQYFDNLTELDCQSNQLTFLPTLPIGLTFLSCRSNFLTTLPPLPNSLTFLDCGGNQLTTLPALPNSITDLYCGANQLTNLSTLPNSLIDFDCRFNAIVSLPTLPNSLKYLNCNNNDLTTLPTLSGILEQLNCDYNSLTTLPSLPSSLINLSCSSNPISSLPLLPNMLSSLTCMDNTLSSLPALPPYLLTLDCSLNQINSIPNLPFYLSYLKCDYNNLTSLSPIGPSLYFLDCSHNQLTSLPMLNAFLSGLNCGFNPGLSCLPKLPNSMTSIRIENTGIICMPNLSNMLDTLNSTPGIMSLPLCNISSGCPFYLKISGNVHQDSSANCIADSLSPGNTSKNIKVQLLKNNLIHEQMYVTNLGEYSFDTGSNDTLDVQIDTTNFPFIVSCPTTFSHNIILTPIDSFKNNINFGIKCIGVDAGVQSIIGSFRPATIREVLINAGDAAQFYNMNCGAFSGTLTTTLTGQVSYVSPSLGALTPSSIVGNTLTYTISDFSAIDPSVAFNFLAMADTTATAGSQVCVTTKITNVINDTHPNNDSLEMCFDIVNSFDPNDKKVSPKNAEAGDWLHYTIRFQNTGNDTAFLVVIQDTLSANLDIPSFTYLASSHNAITQVKNNIVTFTFPKINLLDSLNHEPESHGWIQFKIKLKTGLPNGTITDNKASIYFDFNPPIVTNVAINTIGPLSTNNTLASQSFVHIYPNPAFHYFTIDHSLRGQVKAKLYSIEGRLIQSKTLTKSKEVFSLKNITSGIYLLEVSNDKGEKSIEKILVRVCQ